MRRYTRNRWGRHSRHSRHSGHWRQNLDTSRLLSFRRNMDLRRLSSFRRNQEDEIDFGRLAGFRRKNIDLRRLSSFRRNPDPDGNPWGPSLYDPLSDKENKFKDESHYQGIITKLYKKNPYNRLRRYRRNAGQFGGEEGLFDSIYSRRRNPWSYRNRYRRNPFWDDVKSAFGFVGRGAVTAGKAAGKGVAAAGRGTKKWYDEGGKQKMISAGKKVARGTGQAMRVAGRGIGQASRFAGKKLQALGQEGAVPAPARYRYNPCEACGCDPCECASSRLRRRNPGWSFTSGRPLAHDREFSEMYYRRPTKPLRRRPIGRYRRNPEGLFPKEGLYSSIYSRRRNPGGLFPKEGLYSSIYSRRRNPRRYY